VNLSPNSARTLLQRGLRLLPHSIPLWTEYAKMELVWVERLRRRWEILGVKDAELTPEEGSAEDQSEQGRKAIMDGAVVAAVWQGAKKALLDSLELHQSFLRLLRTFPTVLRLALLEKLVYASLREEGSVLGQTAEGRTILAMRAFEDVEYPGGEKKELEGKRLVDALREMVEEFKRAGKELEGRERDVVLERFAVALRNWEGKVEDDGLVSKNASLNLPSRLVFQRVLFVSPFTATLPLPPPHSTSPSS
jgi:U3 small nucleolar RNA-associated protein 6